MNPSYPIFIPSKGRWQWPLTITALEQRGIPYRVVVEPSELDRYAQIVSSRKLIRAPENFSERGQGSIPVRNYIWELAIAEGARRHWVIDDNVGNFYRLNLNRRVPVASGTIFKCAEDFTDRYQNIAFSGFNYRSFAKEETNCLPPFKFNTRVYSITLINNALPYRWRGRYNEDTDICLRALKDGWCTILFNAFLADKKATMMMRGGNTDTIYNTGDNRRAFAESLASQHPDVARVTWKFGRWHHQVDYSPFKDNRPILRPDVQISPGVNNYGMRLVRVGERDRLIEAAQ